MTWWQILLAALSPTLIFLGVMAVCELREHHRPTRARQHPLHP